MVAIQMTAIKMPDGIGLTFTKVIDELVRGPVGVGEAVNEVKDRAYWEKQVAKPLLGIADEILSMVKTFDPSCELRYTQSFIGMSQGGVTNDFVWWRFRKSWAQVCFRIPQDEHLTAELEEAGINMMDYKWDAYRPRLTPEDLKVHADLVAKLVRKAYES